VSGSCEGSQAIQSIGATGVNCIETGVGSETSDPVTGTGESPYLARWNGAKTLTKSIVKEGSRAITVEGRLLVDRGTDQNRTAGATINTVARGNSEIAIYASGSGGARGGIFGSDTGLALTTSGRIQLGGIGEGGNIPKVLTADRTGLATWKTLAEIGGGPDTEGVCTVSVHSIISYLAGGSLTAEEKKKADGNGDGAITLDDVGVCAQVAGGTSLERARQNIGAVYGAISGNQLQVTKGLRVEGVSKFQGKVGVSASGSKIDSIDTSLFADQGDRAKSIVSYGAVEILPASGEPLFIGTANPDVLIDSGPVNIPVQEPDVVDRCPNMSGIQSTIPAGMQIDGGGNCMPVTTAPPVSAVQIITSFKSYAFQEAGSRSQPAPNPVGPESSQWHFGGKLGYESAKGYYAWLKWSTQGASSCTFGIRPTNASDPWVARAWGSGPPVPLNTSSVDSSMFGFVGTNAVLAQTKQSQTVTYTLTCQNSSGGSDTKSITISGAVASADKESSTGLLASIGSWWDGLWGGGDSSAQSVAQTASALNASSQLATAVAAAQTTGANDPLLDVHGTVRIRGGSPALGKILTSGADGTGTWKTPQELNLVGNNGSDGQGCTLSGRTITCPGGSLTIPDNSCTISGNTITCGGQSIRIPTVRYDDSLRLRKHAPGTGAKIINTTGRCPEGYYVEGVFVNFDGSRDNTTYHNFGVDCMPFF